ncbi:MAG: hypothetical protein IT204_17330 [Fimbriimonadaceae bacterium]|nr:hypothetical protein [Fimbriimonadaceae bacterium]
MNEDSLFYLELGFGILRSVLDAPAWSPQGQRSLVRYLPTMTAFCRLWGWQDPSAAVGSAAGLSAAPLRAAGRCAAVEFAPWPAAAVRPVLRRALRDAADPEWQQALPAAVRSDLADVLAVSWARHWPAGLPEVYAALQQPLLGGDGRLWAHEVQRRAVGRTPWPGRELLPGGSVSQWEWAAAGLLPHERVQACLALAAHHLREDPPASPAGDLPTFGDGA